jgi:hypothetical protein
VGNDPTFAPPLIYENTMIPSTENFHTVSLTMGVYFWRVRARDNVGNLGPWSKWFRLNVSKWMEIEGWSAAADAPVEWQSMDGWDAVLGFPAAWKIAESWSSGIVGPVSVGWSQLEGWNLSLSVRQADWRTAETWSSSLQARILVPVLLSPPDGYNDDTPAATFTWENVWLADNYRIQIDDSFPIVQENDNVGLELDPLVDGTARKGVLLGGSILELREADGAYENLGENLEDNTLNWEHVIENIEAGFDNYTLIIRGYTSGDAENIGVYIWENQGATWDWRFLDNLTSTEQQITFIIPAENLENYVVGENLYVRYLENNADGTQTVLHLDLVIIQENVEGLPSPFVDEVITENFYSYNFTQDGKYRWRVRASVESLLSPWSEIWLFTLDRVMPDRPTLISPYNGENLATSTITLSWTEPPENAFPVRYHVQVATNGTFTPVYWDSGWILETSCTTPPLPDNFYYWWVQARDNAGNLGEFSVSRTFRVDTLPPQAPTPTSPIGKNLSETRPVFEWTAPPENSLPLEYQVKTYDDALNPGPTSPWVTDENWQPATDLANGRYWWTITARDNAGNVGENSSLNWFRVDTVVPRRPVLLWPSSEENVATSTPNLDWAPVTLDNLGNEEPSKPVVYYVTISDDPGFAYENFASGWIENDNWVTPTLADGTWYWRVAAKDNASNIGENSATWQFDVDTTPPSNVALVSPDNENITNENRVLLDWTVGNDNHGPIQYRLLVATTEDFISPLLDTGWVDNDSWLLENLLDNRYYWKVQARDNLLNTFETLAWWFIIENSPPFRPELSWPDNGVWITDNTPNLNWTPVWDISQPVEYHVWIDNDLDPLSVVRESGWVQDDNWIVTPALEDADIYYWWVQARDNTGKLSDNSVTWILRVDSTKPPVPAIQVPAENWDTEELSVLFRWDELVDLSGVVYRFQTDNEPGFTSPLIVDESALVDNSYTYAFPARGTYFWRVGATDGAGNFSGWSAKRKLSIRGWIPLENWLAESRCRPVGWRVASSWVFSSRTFEVGWSLAESWLNPILPMIWFRAMEGWSASISTLPVEWRKADNVSPKVEVLKASFRMVESWHSSFFFMPRQWRVFEGWKGKAWVPSFWVEKIVGVPVLPPRWHLMEAWAAPVYVPQLSSTIELGYIPPGSSATADLSRLGGRVVNVRIVVKPTAKPAEISSVALEIQEFSIRDRAGLPAKAYPYRWFEVRLSGIKLQALDFLEFTIRVEKAWLSWREIDPDDVSVFGSGEGWVEHQAQRIGEDANHWFYSFTSGLHQLYAIAGVKEEVVQTPAVVPVATPETPPPAIPINALGVVVGIAFALGVGAYLYSWPVRFGVLQRRYGRALAGPNYHRAKLRLGTLGKRMKKDDRLRLARLARSLYIIPVPKLVPVERRMARIERVAVRRLEEFIRERRRRVPSVAERRRLAELKRRMAEEEMLTLRRLERFMARRRREAPRAKRKARSRKKSRGS